MTRPTTWYPLVWLRWALARVGYWIRPYDMLADRRRWFWRPAQRCGAPVEVQRRLQEAVDRHGYPCDNDECPICPRIRRQ